VKYVGVDWAYRRAQWCALAPGGEIAGEGQLPADRDGLARLVLELGDEVKACLEMMSGALWVRDELTACGWQVEIADARKVKTVAPLAAKTDKVDARLLAELSRRGLVPALWLPSLDERALRERLRRRMHLVRLRTSAKGRIFGLQTQWGARISLARLRRADGLTLLERAGVPEVWRRSISECLALIDFLDARIAPLDAELSPFARPTGVRCSWTRSQVSASYSPSRSRSRSVRSAASQARSGSSPTGDSRHACTSPAKLGPAAAH
jgi:transposase